MDNHDVFLLYKEENEREGKCYEEEKSNVFYLSA